MERNRGFAPIVLIIIVVAVLAVAGGGSYLILKKEKELNPSPFVAPKEEQRQGVLPQEEFIAPPPAEIPKEESKSTTPPSDRPVLPLAPSQPSDSKQLLGIWKAEKIFTVTPEGELKEFSIPLPLFTQFREKDLCRQWKYVNNDGVCERYDSYSVAGNIITVSDTTEGIIRWEWQVKDGRLEIGQRVDGKLVGKTVSIKVAKVFFDLFSQKAEPPKPKATTLNPSMLLGEWRLEKFLNYDLATGQWKDAQGTATEFQEFLPNTMCDGYQVHDFVDARTFQCISYAPYTVNGDVIALEAYDILSKSKSTAYYRWNIVGGKLELSVGISDAPFLKYIYYKNPPPPLPKEPFVLTADNISPSLGAFKEARVALTSPIKTNDLIHLWITDAAGAKIFTGKSSVFCDQVKACVDPGGTIDPDLSNAKCPFTTKTITNRFNQEEKISDGICFTPAVWGESGKLESKFSVPVILKEVGLYTIHAKLFTSGINTQIQIDVKP